jgi:hypothetical protein
VGRADGGRERVDPGRLDELAGDLDRVDLPALLGADAVLDPDDALDLALDLRAVGGGLRDDLDRLQRVLGDVEFRPVEEDRVPALAQAGRDPRAVRAMVEVERDRDRHVLGPGPPDRHELPGAHRLDGLQRRLNDQGRVEIGGGGEHGLERQVVHDVDRGHAVAVREGGVENLTHRHDRHRTGAP